MDRVVDTQLELYNTSWLQQSLLSFILYTLVQATWFSSVTLCVKIMVGWQLGSWVKGSVVRKIK